MPGGHAQDGTMDSEIIALRCPSCGNASNAVARELRFGYEFNCKHCATVSMLVINRQLYVPQPGERICAACGRVAPRGSRFCQCGRSLVRTCVACSKEFPVDHAICDFCGWTQSEGKPDQTLPRTYQSNQNTFHGRDGFSVRVTPEFITNIWPKGIMPDESYTTAHLTSIRVRRDFEYVNVKKWFKTEVVRTDNYIWDVYMEFGTGANAPGVRYPASSEADARNLEMAITKAIGANGRRTPAPHHADYDDDGNELDEYGEPVD
jgi:hypothetical protein